MFVYVYSLGFLSSLLENKQPFKDSVQPFKEFSEVLKQNVG